MDHLNVYYIGSVGAYINGAGWIFPAQVAGGFNINDPLKCHVSDVERDMEFYFSMSEDDRAQFDKVAEAVECSD